MPHLAQKPHHRRRERIVSRKPQFGGEHAAFERGALGALDQRFPDVEVVFGDGTGGYAVRWVRGEELVFLKEAFGCYCGRHFWRFVVGDEFGWRGGVVGLVWWWWFWRRRGWGGLGI